MGSKVESLKKPTSVGSYSTTDTTVTLSSAVQNSIGYATWDPGGSHEELVYWGGKSGTQVTGMLRGLSLTALTHTEIAGNKKTHDDGETFALTNVHYIINDKPSKTSDETIANTWTFTKSPISSEAANATGELMRYDEAVRTSDAQTIAGKKTFSTLPDTSAGDPVANNDLARKSYVDSQVANIKAENIRNDNFVIGETGAIGNAYSLESQDNTDGGTAVDFGRDAVSNGLYQAQSFIAGSAPAAFSMTVSLLKQGAPTDNIYITIETDNAGNPSGTPVTNGTSNNVAGTALTGAFADVAFTWASVPSLTIGTKYWFVLRRDGANSDVNYYQVEMASNNAFRSGVAKKYTTSWTTNVGTNDDLVFNISGVDGVAVKTSVISANSYRGQENFLGLLYETATQGDTGKVIATEGEISGLTGLTEGADYYPSTTAGDLSTTKQRLFIGQATSTTDIYLSPNRAIIETSAGSADAGKLVKTKSTGKIDSTVIDTGVSNGQIIVADSVGLPAIDGSQVTNIKAGVTIGSGSRTQASGSGTQSVSCGFQPSVVRINGLATDSADYSGATSWGVSNGSTNVCNAVGYDTNGYARGIQQLTTKALRLQDTLTYGVDWSATITLTSTGFDISWTAGTNNSMDATFTYEAIR